MVALLGLGVAGGCASGDRSGIKKFAPPPEDVMPRRLMVAKHSEIDTDSNGYIDGVLVSVYFFNYDRPGPGAEQPFHRDGTLRFELFGPGGEVLCKGQFDEQTMARSASTQRIGPGYALKIDFKPRGFEDVLERTGARMDFEFTPAADPEKRSFGR
jgi:hypothetical protein